MRRLAIPQPPPPETGRYLNTTEDPRLRGRPPGVNHVISTGQVPTRASAACL